METRVSSNDFLTELPENELITIHGGESGWYWLSYGEGVVVREARDFAIDAYIFIQLNRPKPI